MMSAIDVPGLLVLFVASSSSSAPLPSSSPAFLLIKERAGLSLASSTGASAVSVLSIAMVASKVLDEPSFAVIESDATSSPVESATVR